VSGALVLPSVGAGDKIGVCGVSRRQGRKAIFHPSGLGGPVAYQPGISGKLVRRRCWVVICLCHGDSPGTAEASSEGREAQLLIAGSF